MLPAKRCSFLEELVAQIPLANCHSEVSGARTLAGNESHDELLEFGELRDVSSSCTSVDLLCRHCRNHHHASQHQ